MKKTFYSALIALLILSGSARGGQKLTAYFSYAIFGQPKGSPYVEAYISVIGGTVKFIPNGGGKLQSKIEIQWVLKKSSDSSVVYADRYNLLSPELMTDSDAKPNFLDQKRIPAPNGSYNLELTISDKNTVGSKYTIKEPIKINLPNDKLVFSDIELLESFAKSSADNKMSKSGYDLIPFISNFYPREIHSIKFYVELYNGKKIFSESAQPADGNQSGGNDFILRYQIVNEGNKQIVNYLAGLKKMKAEDVNPIAMEIPIDRLSSGNYSLLLEARDRNNQVLAFKSCYFQRSNPISVKKDSTTTGDFTLADINNTFVSPMSNKDTLKDFLACLYPISNRRDRQIAENQINFGTVESMKKFLYYFWYNQDSLNPEQRWQDYLAEVAKVNYSYQCFSRKGYETDQGRVYLQYGPPNAIEIGDNSPNTYPYEIWQYYQLGNQTNRKFVFYSRYRAVSCYDLLHSDATGEPYLYDWNYRLHPMGPIGAYSIDADDAYKNPYNAFGDKTRDSFEHPK